MRPRMKKMTHDSFRLSLMKKVCFKLSGFIVYNNTILLMITTDSCHRFSVETIAEVCYLIQLA